MANRKAVPVLNLGLPDHFIPQGTQDEARAAMVWMPQVSKPKSAAGWHNPSPLPLLLCLNLMFKIAGANRAIHYVRKNGP